MADLILPVLCTVVLGFYIYVLVQFVPTKDAIGKTAGKLGRQ